MLFIIVFIHQVAVYRFIEREQEEEEETMSSAEAIVLSLLSINDALKKNIISIDTKHCLKVVKKRYGSNFEQFHAWRSQACSTIG